MDEEAPVEPIPGRTPKLNRSCEPCRFRKVRCSSAASGTTSRCSRCVERGLNCEFIPVVTRRRRRVDNRIKELEGKIEALLPLVAQINESPGSGYQTTFTEPLQGTLEASARSDFSVTPETSWAFTDTRTVSSRNGGDTPGISELDSMPTSKVAILYDHFQQKLLFHYPAVFLSPNSDVESVRREKPALFRSIVAAAAAALDPSIATTLNQEMEKGHAQSVMVDGEKSLELAQALLISAIWAYPPNAYGGLKFGRHAQMAADIILDLGLLQTLDRQLSDGGIPMIDCLGPGDALMERCRTLVACFLLCSSIALAFRRPSIITYTRVIGKCILCLKTSLYAASQDRTLAAWAELQHQAEDIRSTLSAGERIQSIDDRVQFHIRDSMARLSVWAKNVEQEQTNASLVIHYHYLRVYAYEQFLHSEHQPDDFKPPYILRNTAMKTGPLSSPEYNTHFALNDCLLAGRSLLDTFLALSISDLRTVPVIVYTRMFYVMVIFAKLYISIQSLDSQFRGLIDLQSLTFDLYISKLIVALQAAKGLEGFRVPKVFLGMLERMSQWCVAKLQLQLLDVNFGDDDEWQPMDYTDTPMMTPLTASTNTLDLSPNPNPWPPEFSSIFPFLGPM